MFRHPAPRGLLVDHPVFPVAANGSEGLRPDLGGTVSIRSLSVVDRRHVALQLLAGTALAAEFDLWPGKRGLRYARAARRAEGVQAILGAFPVSLDAVKGRLEGGHRALEKCRESALVGIASICGLGLEDLQPEDDLGFFFEGAFRSNPLLEERPIDPVLGRSLWAYQWDLPEMPEPGEIVFWKVGDPVLVRRLSGALCAELDREGRSAILAYDGASIASDGTDGVLVVGGRHSEAMLGAVEQWAGRDGRSAVLIGEFPPGWDPPSPSLIANPGERRNLAVTGVSLDRAMRTVEARAGRFDAASPADRRALTDAACHLFQRNPSRPGRPAATDPVFRALSLRPEGMDQSTLLRLSGVEEGALIRKVAEGRVVMDGSVWRLPSPPSLKPDPLHAELAELVDLDDPARWLHQALGGADPRDLAAWARSELDELRPHTVRRLFQAVEPEALGQAIAGLRAEAALAELDVGGARRVVDAMAPEARDPWRMWIDLEDHGEAWMPVERDLDSLLEAHPRIAAEWALHTLRSNRKTDEPDDPRVVEIFDRAVDRLDGPLHRWYGLLGASVREPERFADTTWIEEQVDGLPSLGILATQKRAVLLTKRGDADGARELLETLLDEVRVPGRLGWIYTDLANVASDLKDEIRCLLRAHRLLEVAGFRYRTRNVGFNLAMVDLERLDLARAEARLRRTAFDGDPMDQIGRGMLAVAQGDFETLRSIVDRLPAAATERRVQRGANLLRGLNALFDGRFEPARTLLEGAGEDGEPWFALLDAADGRPCGGPVAEDPWEVGRAAEIVRTVRREGVWSPQAAAVEDPGPSFALTCALADAVLSGPDGWMPSEVREAVLDRLESAGMTGWAGRMKRLSHGRLDAFLTAATGLSDAGSLAAVARDDWNAICGALGLSGFEVRSGADGTACWRWGEGDAPSRAPAGAAEVVPLGGRPKSPEAWRLLESLLLQKAPSLDAVITDEAEETLGIAGSGEPVRRLREALRRFAPTGLTVLLSGETGVGKGLAAEAVHQLSGRVGRFVAVNVAAVAGSLFEAELYGSVKGAFTGADRDRAGLAEEADGGTLFLDEIGDLDLSLQVKLLRFLDSGEVRRVGSGRTRKVDVRVIAATHQNLEVMVREGTFRQDLFFRLGSAAITVPPLRERGSDVLVLKNLFAKKAIRELQLKPAKWSREADAALLAHPWPGNVRELRRAVEYALISADGQAVEPVHLPAGIRTSDARVEVRRWEEAHRELRRSLIESSLERNEGNRAAAARELGLSRQTLLYHMRLLGLK